MTGLVVGVDFDGTIVRSAFPEIGKPKFLAGYALRWARARGHKLILDTCREGKYAEDAERAVWLMGGAFDAVNENLPERIAQFNGDCRKISCDIMIDDRAGWVFWPWVMLRILWTERKLGRNKR